MVKDAANLLYAITGFLQRSVVKNVTCVVRRDFGMFLAKDCPKTKSHAQKKLAPVHSGTTQHAIIAIVTSVQEVII